MVYGGFRRQGKMDDNYFNENFAESKREVTKLEDKTYFGRLGPCKGHNLRECNGSKFLGNITQIKAFVFTKILLTLIRRKTKEQKGHYRHALSIYFLDRLGPEKGVLVRHSCSFFTRILRPERPSLLCQIWFPYPIPASRVFWSNLGSRNTPPEPDNCVTRRKVLHSLFSLLLCLPVYLCKLF